MVDLKRWSWGVGVAAMFLVLGCTGTAGKDGAQGVQGPPGDAGQNGTVPPLVNDVTGTVTSDGTTGLAGVSITATPGTATATTDASGNFTFKSLPLGAYEMTFHLSGYNDQTVTVAVNLTAATKVDVVLAKPTPSDAGPPDAGPGPVVQVSDQLAAGFNAPVSVTATATGTGTLTYAWTQTGGPAVTLTGASTATVGFTTPDFVTSLGYHYPDNTTAGGTVLPNARCDVRGLDRDQANHITLQLVVTDGNGLSTTTSVQVASTRPTTGLRNVPIGIPVWLEGNGPIFPLDGGAAQASWSWQITSAPANSKAALFAADGAAQAYASGASGQYAYFIPDLPGKYVLTEAVSNTGNTPCSFTVYAGTWLGMMTLTGPNDTPPVPISSTIATINCVQCHVKGTPGPWPGSGPAPDMFTLWEGTAHATALQRKIEGAAGPHFGEGCLECHTVGYDKSAKNNGFDDLEAMMGWTYPSSNKPGNWSALESLSTPPAGMTNTLADLAGIQCESCHGPQVTDAAAHGIAPTDPSARIKWSEEVCASCHEEYGNHYKPSQWAQQGVNGGHSNRALAVSEAGGGSDHCSRCHSAQGFARYAKNLPGGYYAYLTSDGNPLDTKYPAAGASNTPGTSAQLMALGMNKAQVESQTCQACHDPHSAANPSQLRIYDAIPALPNGLTNVSGLGAGAVCTACHNSRNGEHTDFATQITQSVNTAASGTPVWTSTGVMVPGSLASLATPHTASQTDMFFGFNAYFGARMNPSAHMAVADTCAGCHYKVTTASQVAAKETSNHSFIVDNTICANCHSANVDGVGFQAANRLALDGLRNLWASKLLTNMNLAIDTAGVTVTARAYDPKSGYYTSGTKSQYIPITAVTGITWANIGTVNGQPSYSGFNATAGLTLTLATPATNVVFYDANNNAQPPVTLSQITVTISSLATNKAIPDTGAGTGNSAATFGPLTGAVVWTPAGAVQHLPPWGNGDLQTLYKAYWNLTLLSYDNTFGVHNPAFFNQVVQSTSAALEAVQ